MNTVATFGINTTNTTNNTNIIYTILVCLFSNIWHKHQKSLHVLQHANCSTNTTETIQVCMFFNIQPVNKHHKRVHVLQHANYSKKHDKDHTRCMFLHMQPMAQSPHTRACITYLCMFYNMHTKAQIPQTSYTRACFTTCNLSRKQYKRLHVLQHVVITPNF